MLVCAEEMGGVRIIYSGEGGVEKKGLKKTEKVDE